MIITSKGLCPFLDSVKMVTRWRIVAYVMRNNAKRDPQKKEEYTYVSVCPRACTIVIETPLNPSACMIVILYNIPIMYYIYNTHKSVLCTPQRTIKLTFLNVYFSTNTP